MNEPSFYNALAMMARGDRRVINKWKTGLKTWEATYHALAAQGKTLPDPKIEFEKMTMSGIRLLLFSDVDYPALLREIPHPPFGIYVRGGLRREKKALSVVGTRRATPEGKNIASRFAAELAAHFTIVSGLAFGIDAAAHEGCLRANGDTIAVLAGGLDSVYPKNNDPIAEKILASGGALISEYPLKERPNQYRFLERNRLISGLSTGTLIVEVPEHSGALATARFAFEQNRDVFVIPGTTTHPNFKGSHSLIRQGAELVTELDDILEAYGVPRGKEKTIGAIATTPEEMLILKALGSFAAPVDVDKILEMTRLEPRIVNQALSFLLLRNCVKEVESGYTIS